MAPAGVATPADAAAAAGSAISFARKVASAVARSISGEKSVMSRSTLER